MSIFSCAYFGGMATVFAFVSFTRGEWSFFAVDATFAVFFTVVGWLGQDGLKENDPPTP